MTTPKIIQADRDRAAAIARDMGFSADACNDVSKGAKDYTPFVRHVATHRIEAFGELLSFIERLVKQTSVGPGSKPVTRSKYASYPAGIYHEAVALIAKHKETEA